MRLKKYYSYFIKQNRHTSLDYLREHSMAPLYHLFDTHHLCDPNWCHKRNNELLTNVVTTPESIPELKDGGGELDDDEADAAMISIATPPTTNIIVNDGSDDIGGGGDDVDDEAVGIDTPPKNQENSANPTSSSPESTTPLQPSTKSSSERDQKGYYRDMITDKDLWDALVEKYERYRSEEMLAQCVHEYDTKKNEGMNTCVAKYAPKNKTYCKSISLEARVKVAAGIYTVGYHFLWTEIMKELQMVISPHFESYLLQRDEKKVSDFNREHTNVKR